MPEDDLENLRKQVKYKHQWDDEDEPIAQITICRFPEKCGDGPCENCFRFWEDDKRPSAEIEAELKRLN